MVHTLESFFAISNEYTLGRFDYNQSLIELRAAGDLWMSIFGFGPGTAVRSTPFLQGGDEPHNDFLRVLVDYGDFGLVLFIAAMSIVIGKMRAWGKYLIYQGLMFLTDNTAIYLFHYFALLIVLAAVKGDVEETQSHA